MDSETDTDTISLCDSVISRENYKSPESSDCEGYATPLASSLTDLSSTIDHGITINVPEDVELSMDSGERTPVSTPRAYSPPIVKQTMYLQKPRILVMTQREIHDESSEEEFFDADVQIRDVAQQLLDGVENGQEDDVTMDTAGRADTPIGQMDMETETRELVTEEEEEEEETEHATPVQFENEEEVSETDTENLEAEVMITVQELTEKVLNDVEMAKQTSLEQLKIQPETIEKEEIAQEDCFEKSEEVEMEMQEQIEAVKAAEDVPMIEDVNKMECFESQEEVQQPSSVLLSQDMISCESIINDDNIANNLIEEVVQNTQTSVPDENTEESTGTEAAMENQQTEDKIAVNSENVEGESQHIESQKLSPKPENESSFENILNVTTDRIETVLPDEPFEISEDAHQQNHIGNEIEDKQSSIAMTDRAENDRQLDLFEQMPEVFSVITVANTPLTSETIPSDERHVVFNQETIENEPMTTLVNSDEVKTSLISADEDMFSDGSTHEVKVDFDGYSSGKEESLSSSTSSESFEFAEPVSSNHIQDERKQALRNSIIERYPSNDTDEDELDDFDESSSNGKQISAELEQLVADINAYGRDEEQQMSAYLVGKKMAAEKKRKSAMDTGIVTSTCHDQTVQTDNDSFILVDRHFPVAMESLQVEIDKLQADLEKVKNGEKELLKINSQLKEELEESQQTIDGIEVEAEQQYTELTSEIDELCEIVQKKDQELATIKEKVANLSVSESNLKDDVDSQRIIVQRQKEIIESLREELDAITKKLGEVSKSRDKAIEEATLYKMKNMERDRFLSREAQMSMEIEDLQRELNKQKLILNQTSMAKLADTFDRKVLHLENELRERDMLICKQNQIINSHRKSPTGSVITHRKMQPRASVLAAAGNLPSAGSSSESFQNGLDGEAKEALLSFILSDRHNQLANIYNIGRILDLSPQEERAVERHLTKDRFT